MENMSRASGAFNEGYAENLENQFSSPQTAPFLETAPPQIDHEPKEPSIQEFLAENADRRIFMMPPLRFLRNYPHSAIPRSFMPNLFADYQTTMIMDYNIKSMTAAMLLLAPSFVTIHSTLLRKLRGPHEQVISYDRHRQAHSLMFLICEFHRWWPATAPTTTCSRSWPSLPPTSSGDPFGSPR